ncbi:glycoside hydrolase family 2 TIM barrel-domain containing protein [Paraconexibacter sp. AEG42_29]|uniref:glycoside hydrolase family 2 protein n=1 Tax=Paraconexibacter sp. AEG42_29 TaxID=2997339 RepID=UPI00339D3005
MPAASLPMIDGGPPGRVALNGAWVLRSDPNSHGTLKGWQTGNFAGSNVTVPNAANGGRVTGPKQKKSFAGTTAWYRTAFTVPEAGRYEIRMESVNHKATVWVDGKAVAHHTGEYLPFEAHATLAPDVPHTLVIRADYRDPMEMKRTAWHRTWFNFGGVNREVTVRKLTESDLTTPTIRTRLQSNGHALVDLSVHVTNRLAEEREIPVSGSLQNGDQKIEFDLPKVSVPPNQTRVLKTRVDVASPRLWAPGSPNLYELQFNAGSESAYRLKTGLREVKKVGTRIVLNGKPIILRGASIHEDAMGRGDALTSADMDQTIRELQALGANATRAQHPLNPALMERLDAAGIMVWMGVGPVDAPGAWTSRTPALVAQGKRRVRTSLFQLQTHPSIIVWNLANEVAGNGRKEGQSKYIDEMARELKRRDPGRLVGLDVWGIHPPKTMGPMYRYIDAIGDTNYIGWYERTLDPRPSVGQAIRDHVKKFERIFAGKILVITEFGAEANDLNATNIPGGFAFQASLLKLHVDIYRANPRVSGMLVWNLRDFGVTPAFYGGSIRRQVPDIKIVRGLNQKGLFTYDGKPKPSLAVVRDALAGK